MGESILVTDDELAMRGLLKELLLHTDPELDVDTAEDGQDALNKINAKEYRLLLTDLSMPRMTGLQLLETVHKEKPSLPVIVVTALGDEDIILKCFSAGAWDFITKPFRVDQVQAAVRRALVVSRDFDPAKAELEITSMGPGWLEITASSEVEYVYRFRKFTEMLLRRKVPNETLEDLRLAVEEIGRNAVEWGNEFAEDKRVKLGYKFANNQIMIKVQDEGKGFNPDDVEDPSEDPVAAITRRLESGKRPGGYGIKIVQKTMDEVKYSDGGTSVLLVKNVPPMDE